MTLSFELHIWLSFQETYQHSTRYRFAERPEIATVKYLVERERSDFEELFGMAPEDQCASISFLKKKDRIPEVI